VIGLWTRKLNDYANEALRIIERRDALFRRGPTVVMGDFNSGTHLISGRREAVSRPHGRLVAALEARGLVSAYHAFHRVAHGSETHATYYHRFDRADRWHIDFCFVPSAWAGRIARVEVGGPKAHTTSDHRPVMVEVGLAPTTAQGECCAALQATALPTCSSNWRKISSALPSF
jgi:endonuclease/exonuclease/phosphatase family metal-dependent hydrolase